MENQHAHIKAEAERLLLAAAEHANAEHSRANLSEKDLAALSNGAARLLQETTRLAHHSFPLLRSITQSEAVVLLSIQNAPESVSPMQIADAAGFTRPRITQIVNSLEERGLIKRVQDEHDKRMTRLYFTKKGEAAMAEWNAGMQALTENLLLLLGKEDSEVLLRIVARVADIVEGSSLEPSIEFLKMQNH